jgi:hypothetical protein
MKYQPNFLQATKIIFLSPFKGTIFSRHVFIFLHLHTRASLAYAQAFRHIIWAHTQIQKKLNKKEICHIN